MPSLNDYMWLSALSGFLIYTQWGVNVIRHDGIAAKLNRENLRKLNQTFLITFSSIFKALPDASLPHKKARLTYRDAQW
jgi:hypothetical protein